MLSRRRFLVGAGAGVVVGGGLGALALVESGVLPGKIRLDELRGACGEPGRIPSLEPGPVIESSFASSARRVDVAGTVLYPPGSNPGDPLPVCIALHGRGSDHRSIRHDLELDRFLAAATAEQGCRPSPWSPSTGATPSTGTPGPTATTRWR